MEKKTIGQFIAALRKANGFTQQEVADRLVVSNKAVSRWERDECAPDISVIPALAELLGVTCDELLRGERILKDDSASNEGQQEKRIPKVEKQVRALLNRTISDFKNMIGIGIAIAVAGLILMFGISYGFFRPVIGFAVMLLFEAVSATVIVIAVNKMKARKEDNELFENAAAELTERYDYCLGTYSFYGLYSVVAVILLSIPYIMELSDSYIDSVLSFDGFIGYYFVPIVLVLSFIYLMAKKPYIAWILQKELVETELAHDTKEEIEKIKKAKSLVKKMNILQNGMVFVAGALFITAPWFSPEHPAEEALIVAVMWAAGLGLLLGNIISFIIFLVKNKTIRKHLWLPGVRNVSIVVSGLLCIGVHNIFWSGSSGNYHRYDLWHMEYLWYAIGWALLMTVAFAAFDMGLKKYRKQSIK